MIYSIFLGVRVDAHQIYKVPGQWQVEVASQAKAKTKKWSVENKKKVYPNE